MLYDLIDWWRARPFAAALRIALVLGLALLALAYCVAGNARGIR